MRERDQQIRDAINPLFWWAHEPVLVATAVTNAVIATLDYAEIVGWFQADGPLLPLVIAWVTMIGLIVRSQYTPYAHRTNGTSAE